MSDGMSEGDRYLDAAQAAAYLGVSVPTLYAYVSRGLLRSEAVPGGGRRRRYERAQLTSFLLRRGQLAPKEERAEREALYWGAPLLDSSISRVQDGALRYREVDAVGLSREARFEQAAMLLWTGDRGAAYPSPRAPLADDRWLELAEQLRRRPEWDRPPPSPLDRFAVLVPLAGAVDPRAFDRRPEIVREQGAHLQRLLVLAAGGEVQALAAGAPLAPTLARAWAPDQQRAPELIEAALVLCAEHELNVSAFTGRCVASADASPYHVVAAGLAALAGPRHGGHVAQVDALFDECELPERAAQVVDARLRRGERIPGFEHPLYPEGDPRGAELMRLVDQKATYLPGARLARALCQAAEARCGGRPTLDVGLIALCRALGLGGEHAVSLFAIGRTAGWIAHALEQYASGRMIRPRARWVPADGSWPA